MSDDKIIRPLAGGVLGTLKAEESRHKLLNAMGRAGTQLSFPVCAVLHKGINNAVVTGIKPGGGPVELEQALAALVVGSANVAADYLMAVDKGALSGIEQTDGFIEGFVDFFRLNLANCVTRRRIKKLGGPTQGASIQ